MPEMLRRRRILPGRRSGGEPVEAVSRQLGVPVWQLERWRARALAGLKTGLRERSEDPAERELAEAHRRIGELSMEVEFSAPASSAPALWPAGGRADGRRELPSYR